MPLRPPAATRQVDRLLAVTRVAVIGVVLPATSCDRHREGADGIDDEGKPAGRPAAPASSSPSRVPLGPGRGAIGAPPPRESADRVGDDDDWSDRIGSDPATAAGEIAAVTDLDLRDALVIELMETWVLRDPAGADAWVDSLPAGALRDTAREELYLAWASEAPEAAADHLGRRLDAGDLPELADAVAALANAWGVGDPAAAAAWLTDLPEPGRPTRALGALASVWGTLDPAAARQWVESLDDGPGKTSAARNLALSWAESTPNEAMAWVDGTPTLATAERAGLVAAILATWADLDPDAAGTWVLAREDTGTRDRSAAILAGALVEARPESAIEWLRAIDDPTRRGKAADETFDRWLADDPEAAVPGLIGLVPTLEGDPSLRRSVLDALVRHDPGFRDAVLDQVAPR